jgi:hypothetical protein
MIRKQTESPLHVQYKDWEKLISLYFYINMTLNMNACLHETRFQKVLVSYALHVKSEKHLPQKCWRSYQWCNVTFQNAVCIFNVKYEEISCLHVYE